MKKAISMLLCLLLLAPLCTAQAKTFSYTIPQLIQRQLNANSSLKVNVEAEVSGSAPSFADAQTWEMLKTALPSLSVGGTYILSKSQGAQGNSQTKLAFKNGETVLSSFVLSGRGEDYLLETDLLPDILLAVPRDMNALFRVLTAPGDGEWPSLWRVMSTISAAGDAFNAQLEEALSAHMADMNEWLQGYTTMQMSAGEGGKLQPVQTVRVPSADLIRQTKQLLANLYADEQLLTLLRQVLSQQEAEAYLESGMLPLFYASLDNVQLESEIRITRTYDEQGQLVGEEIVLPFVAGTGLKALKLSSRESGDSKSFGVEVTLSTGASYRFTCMSQQDGQNDLYTGELACILADGQTGFAANYALEANWGVETYDETQKGKERRQSHQLTLHLQPADGQSFPEQQLSLLVDLTAGASNTNAAYCNATLNWKDMTGDALITLRCSSNTSAGIRQTEADAGSAVRLENLSVPDLHEWLTDTVKSVQLRMQELVNNAISGTQSTAQ